MKQPLNILELFAGSRSIGNVAEIMGMNVFSSDIVKFDGIDYVCDILNFDVDVVPFIPNIIWASIPCTSYSISAISHHRNGTIPISDFAKKSDKILEKTISIIKHFLYLNNNMKYFIENPMGMMRKMPQIKFKHERVTVTYCSYGDKRMKPTDIWTNNIYSLYNPMGWYPRPKCWNGNKKCHHEPSPRGSKSGTQGLKNDYERSKIPPQLCLEILTSCCYVND